VDILFCSGKYTNTLTVLRATTKIALDVLCEGHHNKPAMNTSSAKYHSFKSMGPEIWKKFFQRGCSSLHTQNVALDIPRVVFGSPVLHN
jgi:hypothetical protein